MNGDGLSLLVYRLFGAGMVVFAAVTAIWSWSLERTPPSFPWHSLMFLCLGVWFATIPAEDARPFEAYKSGKRIGTRRRWRIGLLVLAVCFSCLGFLELWQHE